MAEIPPAAEGQPGNGGLQFSDELLASVTNPKPDEGLKDELSPDVDDVEAVLADGEEGDETETDEAPDEALGMRLAKFARAAGWKLEEFYNGVTIPIDGQDVPIGKALNDSKGHRDALASVSRERDELREKLNQNAATVPTAYPQVSPEAQSMLIQAQNYQQQLDTTDWTQYEQGQATAARLELMQAVGRLQSQAQAKQAEYQGEVSKKLAEAYETADRQTRAQIPGWADPAVMAREKREIGDMIATRYGRPASSVGNIVNPMEWQILKDLKDALGQVEQVRKKARTVRKVGKTLPAGSRVSGEGEASRREQARALKDAATRGEKSKIRQGMDLGPLPGKVYPR